MKTYKVYAKQKMIFNTLTIEALSREEAMLEYEKLWNTGVKVYSLDYDEDSVEFFIERETK